MFLSVVRRRQPTARAGESIRKAARRQAQIRDAGVSSTSPMTTTPIPFPNTPLSNGARHSTSPNTSGLGVSPSLKLSDAGPPSVVANRTLQASLLGSSRQSKLQQTACEALASSSSKEDALEIFFALARSGSDGGGGTTPQVSQSLSRTLLAHHARGQLGAKAYAIALQDAVGTTDDRWATLSDEETRAFAVYQCLRLERHAERRHVFSDAAGMTVEGGDNEAVALVEYQLRRFAKDVGPVSTTVLADLMHLDVSWTAALHLYSFAQEHRGVDPPVEMSDRLLGLMTGYRSNGIGSRPWERALRLYERVLSSGYTPTLRTHTHALDALWRAGDQYHRLPSSRGLDAADRERIWNGVLRVRQEVEASGLAASIAGDEGCAYYEALLKAVCAAGKTDVALRLLEEMEGQSADTSFRLLVPTAESYAAVMAACHAEGKVAHALAVRALFRQHYTLRDLHSEVLLIYLQSLRNVVRSDPSVGEQIVELMHGASPLPADLDNKNGKARRSRVLLDRPCAVAALHLLVSRAVTVKAPHTKQVLAIHLFDCYDGNVWLQEPLPRKIELQSVFRYCYLIGLDDASPGVDVVRDSPLIQHVAQRLRSVFGASSPEMEWLRDTEVYALEGTVNWKEALTIFTRHVQQRPPEQVKFLPVPLRQVREMFVAALLRACRASAKAAGLLLGGEDFGLSPSASSANSSAVGNNDDTFFFLEDDAQDTERAQLRELAQVSLRYVEDLVCGGEPPAATPCDAVAELQVTIALCSTEADIRQEYGLRAMKSLGIADASSVTPRLILMIATALGLTEEYVENTLTEGHPQLRARALAELAAQCGERPRGRPIERVYM